MKDIWIQFFFVEIDNSFFNSDIFQFERNLKKYNSNIILSIVYYVYIYKLIGRKEKKKEKEITKNFVK